MPKSVSPLIAPLACIAAACAEIAVFIAVGGIIGIIPCLCLVLLSAALGIALLRADISAMPRLLGKLFRQSGAAGANAAERRKTAGKAAVSHFWRAFAAILLIIPGFISSLVGLILLLPPVQALLFRRILRRGKAEALFSTFREGGKTETEIIDLAAEPERGEQSPPSNPQNSPWRQD